MQELAALRFLMPAVLLVLAAAVLPASARAQTAPLEDIQAIAAGWSHTCALTNGGAVKCWGYNEYGQLGDNSTTDSLTPVDVFGLTSGMTAIAAENGHACVLTSGGGVKCWGVNWFGQLGDGSTTNRLTPADVTGLGSGVTAIAAGGSHSCALTSGGAVKCWGRNLEGQLGDNNSTVTSLTPVDVTGLGSGVTAIAAGESHTCALLIGEGVKCWGHNAYGQLGDNSTADRLTPVDVAGLGSGVTAIAAGEYHTCAVLSGGGVKCWGRNDDGQLGDGSFAQRLTPVDVTGLSGVTAIMAEWGHTCALVSSGGVKCWGRNDNGQLGDGSFAQRLTPVDVTGLSGVTAIAAGWGHTCALVSGGGVKCWGNNDRGQLGDNSSWRRLAPADVSGFAGGVSGTVAGWGHTCALSSGGGVKCWGGNWHGQLGDNSTTNRLTPVDVTGLGSGLAATAVGGHHSCALSSVGAVNCWGNNEGGQLGDNSTTRSTTPVEVTGLGSGVTAITAGYYSTCALLSGGGVKCWGYNLYGQLGDNSNVQRPTPVDVTGLGSGVTAIAAGWGHTCALLSGGAMKCWGYNEYGQLGDNSTMDRLTPVDVTGLGGGVNAIAVGFYHTCALTSGGAVKCWGRNEDGQLGDNSTTQRLTPVDITALGSGVSAIAAGARHTCALMSGGGAKCWGDGWFGQLGENSTTRRLTPVDVLGLGSGVTAIATGGYHTCALLSGGAKCWGYNEVGQVGDGTARLRPVPAYVLIVPPGAPTGVVATAGDAEASVAFTAPASNGGGTIDLYRATCGSQSATGSASPINITGLNNGSPVSCTVAAHNAAGWGAESVASNSVTPSAPTAPDAPTSAIGTPGDGQISVSFAGSASAGTLAGGAAATITQFTATCGAQTNTGSTSPIVVSGLANGTAFACTVRATNNVPLNSAESVPSSPVTPLAPTHPSAPTGVAGSAGNGQINVSFTGSTSAGTLPGGGAAMIIGYTATCGAHSNTGSASPILVTGLTNGLVYTCTVKATNTVPLHSADSTPSAPLTPFTIPAAPTIGVATAGNASASVAFTANGNGGAAIDQFRVTCNPGAVSATGSASPITVTGLSNGTTYTCTAAAHNAAGWGPESASSNSVTPPGVQRAFVAAQSGNDANVAASCSVGAPCRTFAVALQVLVSGGEILATESGEYGPVTLASSAILIGAPGQVVALTAASGNAVTIATGGVKTVLRGLTLVGAGGSNGIAMSAGTSLAVENCFISGFAGSGIDVNGPSAVSVVGSTFRDNDRGVSLSDGVTATIVGSRFLGNTGHGVRLVGVVGDFVSRVTIDRSVIVGTTSDWGVSAQSLHDLAHVHLQVTRSTFANSAQAATATSSVGGVAALTINRSKLSGNGIALVQSGTGAVLYSRGNNSVSGNVTNSSGSITPLAPM